MCTIICSWCFNFMIFKPGMILLHFIFSEKAQALPKFMPKIHVTGILVVFNTCDLVFCGLTSYSAIFHLCTCSDRTVVQFPNQDLLSGNQRHAEHIPDMGTGTSEDVF